VQLTFKNCVTCLVIALACCLVQQVLMEAVAQEQPQGPAAGAAASTKSGGADGAWSPAQTGERRPLYRLRKSDVLAIAFTFSPEFDQTVTVQPDGLITLKGIEQLRAEGLTVPELEQALTSAYATILHEPEITITLKDFDKPYFVASGEVARPGKYELRADTTVNEAVAIAGGFTAQARQSQVVLFRHVSEELVESRVLDVKAMLKSRRLEEDFHLRPGDLVYVPQTTMSKIRKYLPASNLGLYLNPTQF